MSIEKIKEKILSEAEREADNFLSEEKRKIEEERKSFIEQKSREINSKTKAALLKIDNDKKREIDRKSLEEEREILSRKRALIDELFAIVENKFASMDKKTYREFLIALIVHDAPNGSSEIVVNERDFDLFTEKIISGINRKLGKGKKISLSSERMSIKGGCIIKGNEVEIDDSIETLLKDEREKEEMSIAKKLFGESK